MAKTTEVMLPSTRYTRADFTALRAYLNRLPIERISDLYYSEDDLEALKCNNHGDLKRRIEGLLDRLIVSATEANRNVADLLASARRTGLWSSRLADFVVSASESNTSAPDGADAVSLWFKPTLAAVLKAEGIGSIRDLISCIEARGAGWWRPIPLVGPGRASRVEAWLAKHGGTLGPVRIKAEATVPEGSLVVIGPHSPTLPPLEQIMLPSALDGSGGINRAPGFCQIKARNDLQALNAYLYKFRNRPSTERTYRRELERLLLWAISERGVALSSLQMEDCEAYIDFLSDLPERWRSARSTRMSRRSADWRPFRGQLKPESQAYAFQAVRLFFNWLVNVRYLAGNPWATISGPLLVRRLHPMQIGKALPESLWDKLVLPNGVLPRLANANDGELSKTYRLRGAATTKSMAAQYRLALAAILLMGEAGLRRSELVSATRERLNRTHDLGWTLTVIGKRNVERSVTLSDWCIDAIRAHWKDRGLDFEFEILRLPLVSPIWIPPVQTAQDKHIAATGELTDQGLSSGGVYRLLKRSLRRIADDESNGLTAEERHVLTRTAPHALRHTFATMAVANDVPLDVVQKVLGHVSLNTTTIYVQAEEKRKATEMARFHARKRGGKEDG